MDLNLQNRVKVVRYLSSTDAFKKWNERNVAKHLDSLIKWDQFDAVEDAQGNLIYAWAWYKLSDKAFEDYRKFISPRRVDRGSNMVALFGMNGSLSVGSMLRVCKRVVKSERPKTFTIYTTKGKWITTRPKLHVSAGTKKKQKMAREFMRIIKGGKDQCHQQQL